MKRIVLLCIILLSGLVAEAQETFRYARRDTCDLYLDIYRPAADAEVTLEGKAKPTVLFVFGGGFIMGKRNDPFAVEWFRRLNREGYAVVSIDYRLGMKGYKVGKGLSGAYKASKQFYAAQQMGVEDLFSAVTYLDEHKEELGIDPGNLVVAGSSAGAIIAQAAEYDIVCGRTDGLPEGFNFKGVMSFAGAVISVSGAPNYPSAPCPVLMLHGTVDQAVAYKKFGALGRGVWGSDYLAGKWAKKGYTGWCIYRFKDRTHDVAAYMNHLWDIERAFLEQNVILGHDRTVDALDDDPSLPSWMKLSLNDIYK